MFSSLESQYLFGGHFKGIQYLYHLTPADVLDFCDTIEALLVKAEDRISLKNNKS